MRCYKKIEEEATIIASLQANSQIEKNLLEDPSQKNSILEQFISYFKILLIPNDVLKKYM